MSIVVETLIVALVAYRLWRLIAQDDITEPFRRRLFGTRLVRSISGGAGTEMHDRPWAARLVECGWCLGTWLALGVAFGAWAVGWVASPPLLVGLAAAVGVGFLSERLV